MPPEKIGRYEIQSELGRGGMAAVYLANDPRFKREVAVKILPPQLLSDPVYRARFEREAQTIAALEHPAIVPVYDFGEEEGQLYLVMRYMPGGSLADKLKAGILPPVEIVNIITQITSALDQVHARGIIHRDLKPGNILFDQYNDAYLSDFGIARLSEATTTLTGAGIVGTPAYMSPEQARGDTEIDGRSDLYALGAIIFQMLSGKLPYESTTPLGLAMKHLTDPVPSIVEIRPDLPIDYDRVIETAMAKNPTERYQTGEQLASALEAVTQQIGRSAQTVPPPRMATAPSLQYNSLPPLPVSNASAGVPIGQARPPKGISRLPWFIVAAGAVLVLGLCAGGIFLGGMALGLWGSSQPASPTAAVAQNRNVLPYLEDFTNPASGWPNYAGANGQSGYDAGSYHILVNATNQQITAVPGKNFTDIVIEFDVTETAGPEDAYYGALCRYLDDENYYYLIIGSDGYFNIGKIVNGENHPLSTVNSSPAIQTGQAQNSLRVECNGDILALFANGELLAQVQDADFSSGDVGLLAGTLETPGADIHFTNYYVTQP